MKSKRRIQTIMSLDTGQQIESNEVFKNQFERESEIFQLRNKIEVQIQRENYNYVCVYCMQPIAIRGRKNNNGLIHYYFTHLYNSKECIIKTGTKLTEEEVRRIKYNGVKESKLHFDLKNEIARLISIDKSVSVDIDKVYKNNKVSSKWRKPDILAKYSDKKIAFELQLSTTFLSVIVGRNIYYKEHGVFLIWVFNEFPLSLREQKFTHKDVFYNNNYNAFIFDDSSKEKSIQENELVLKCIYKKFFIKNNQVEESLEEQFVKISDLTFNHEDITVYYYDSYTNKINMEEDLLYYRAEDEYSKKKIDYVVEVMRKLYTDDIVPEDISFLDVIESKKEIELLNKKLAFSTNKKSFISKLFYERNKKYFLQFICENEKIYIDIDSISNENNPIIKNLFSLDIYDFKIYSYLLFRVGYKLTNIDKKIINSFKSTNTTDNISKWAIILYLSKVPKSTMSEIREIDNKILNPILSLKLGVVIGFDYKSLKQICNNVLEYRKEFSKIFIQAMKHYNRYETILQDDKKGRLKNKIDNIIKENHKQETKYNTVLFNIFPELFTCSS